MLFRYRMIQIFKKPSRFFWGLIFPLVLGALFYSAFGTLGTETWSNIPVAVVEEEENESFSSFLENMEGEYLDVTAATEEEALQLLEDGDVTGIFYEREEPSCTIAKNGSEESILVSLMDSYNSYAELIEDVLSSNPEKLQDVMDAMEQEPVFTKEVSLGGNTYDYTLNYFFALIAMACFFGSFLGNDLAEENAANKSALGARRSISPLPKLKMALTDMVCGILVHFLCIVVLLCYLDFVLGVNFSGSFGGMLLICFLGSLTGICFGIALGCSGRIRRGLKDLLLALAPLGSSFLAGLMVGSIKDTLEKSCPIVNRINPATLVSDSFYCLVVYNDSRRLAINLITLSAISVFFLIWAFLGMRRERYDSI